VADPTSSPNDRPLKASPEVIATPPKDAGNLAAQQQDASSKTVAATPSETAEQATNATFSSTNQHVADQQGASQPTERFTGTKHNIALINDPKNGPRFTLTKKEAGLVEPEAASEKDTDRTEGIGESKPASKDVSPSAEASSAAEKSDDASAPNTAAIGLAFPTANTAPGASPTTSPPGSPPDAEPPGKVPVDSSKTFIGPNGTYYDEAWRWMDWRGTKRSWNWSAALTFGHWFAYRRLFGLAAGAVVWLMAIAAAVVNNVHIGIVAVLLALTVVMIGQYANILYFTSFRRSVAHITEKGEGSYDELTTQLAEAGGINPIAPWIMAGISVIGMVLVVAATYFWRGGLLLNIWPL